LHLPNPESAKSQSNGVDDVRKLPNLTMMKFICQISERKGTWTAEHASQDIGPIRVTASSRGEVLRKMEEEIRYWLEMCPCTGQAYRHLQLELVESSKTG